MGLFLYEDFWKTIFWLVLQLEISCYRVMISWRILASFRRCFWRLYFCMVKYLNFHNSSFAWGYFFYVNGKATVWHTPCWINYCFFAWVSIHFKKHECSHSWVFHFLKNVSHHLFCPTHHGTQWVPIGYHKIFLIIKKNHQF